MKVRSWAAIALAMVPAALASAAIAQSQVLAASDVYIEQSHGRVAPGTKVQSKPPPEATSVAIQSTGPTAPVTCNAQNASSQACYTATQQTRPATR